MNNNLFPARAAASSGCSSTRSSSAASAAVTESDKTPQQDQKRQKYPACPFPKQGFLTFLSYLILSDSLIPFFTLLELEIDAHPHEAMLFPATDGCQLITKLPSNSMIKEQRKHQNCTQAKSSEAVGLIGFVRQESGLNSTEQYLRFLHIIIRTVGYGLEDDKKWTWSNT
jgi:hypothetical protein